MGSWTLTLKVFTFSFLTNKGKYTTNTGYSSRAVVSSLTWITLCNCPQVKVIVLTEYLWHQGEYNGSALSLWIYQQGHHQSPMLISYYWWAWPSWRKTFLIESINAQGLILWNLLSLWLYRQQRFKTILITVKGLLIYLKFLKFFIS